MNNLLSLLQLSDPALPIGGFSHSYGLETYVQRGVVKDRLTANEFIVQMLSRNIQFTDAAFVSLAFDASARNDFEELKRLDQHCSAVKLPREIRQASGKLGVRLLKIFESLQEDSLVHQMLQGAYRQSIDANHSIVYGMLASILKIEKQAALTGFYYNASAAMVTNSVKLVPLGQQDGQQILFSLQSLIETLVEASMSPDPDLIGLCCAGFDIRSMQHERLYTRLYMS